MTKVSMFSGEQIPLEMHKVRVVQKLTLLPIEERAKAMAARATTRFCCAIRTSFWICSPTAASTP